MCPLDCVSKGHIYVSEISLTFGCICNPPPF